MAALRLAGFDWVDMSVIMTVRNIIAVMSRRGSWRLDKDAKLAATAVQSSFLRELQASVTAAWHAGKLLGRHLGVAVS